MAIPPLEEVVYGPIDSRRLGRSLGINLLPPGLKVCNLNCAYCQYGWTREVARYRGQGAGWPSPAAVQSAVGARLAAAAAADEIIDRLTIAGHGEPTLHPAFDETVAAIVEARDRIAPRIPIAILSNSMTAGVTAVKKGLARVDERYMKLDAGDPFTFGRVNGSTKSLIGVIDALRALPPVTIQSMFVTDGIGDLDNTSDVAVSLWLAAVETIKAAGVHVYTLDRAPALGTLRPVPATRLREIAERVRCAGIHAEVFAAH